MHTVYYSLCKLVCTMLIVCVSSVDCVRFTLAQACTTVTAHLETIADFPAHTVAFRRVLRLAYTWLKAVTALTLTRLLSAQLTQCFVKTNKH
jgi:hypothetical protein